MRTDAKRSVGLKETIKKILLTNWFGINTTLLAFSTIENKCWSLEVFLLIVLLNHALSSVCIPTVAFKTA